MIKATRFLLWSILVFIILCLNIQDLKAQTACAQTLRQARTVFDEGRIHEIETLVSSCIEKGFTDEERTEAYRLLILSYIYLDEADKADEAMLALLRVNHHYQVNEQADPTELIVLYETFRTWPIFRIGGKLGGNVTSANLLNTGGANNLNSTTGGNDSEYKPKLGFQAAVAIDVPFLKILTINGELGFYRNSFENTINLYSNPDGTIASNSILIENQSWLGFQTMVQYRVLKSKINPYVALGGGINYLLSDKVIATREVLNEQPVKENTIDLKNGRLPLNYFASAAIGIKSKWNSGMFVTELRFKYGLSNQQDSENILNSVPEYIFDYYGSYNEFTTIVAEFSVGYLVDIYKPKKLIK